MKATRNGQKPGVASVKTFTHPIQKGDNHKVVLRGVASVGGLFHFECRLLALFGLRNCVSRCPFLGAKQTVQIPSS